MSGNIIEFMTEKDIDKMEQNMHKINEFVKSA